VGDRLPAGYDIPGRPIAHLLAPYPEDQLGRAVPEPDVPGAVDVEDPVADGFEQPGRLLALGGDGVRGRLGSLGPAMLRVKPGHPHRGAHKAGETFDELDVLVRVRPLVPHQLDDADD